MLIFRWGQARQMLEIFPERRLIGKIQLIADLLDVLARKTQQIFGFQYHIVIYYLGSGPAESLFYDQ